MVVLTGLAACGSPLLGELVAMSVTIAFIALIVRAGRLHLFA